MSIMDAFRTFVGAAPANVTPAGAAANPTIPNQNNANKSDGSVAAIPAATKNPNESPLEGFAKMWETPKDDNGNTPPSLVPKLNLDPTKLAEQVSKMDFLSSVPQDLMAKAMSGSDPASLLAVMNHVAQQGFQHGITSNAKLIEGALGAQANTLLTHTLPTTIRDHSTKTAVVDMAPIMNNPAVAPLAETVRQNFVRNNPTASPQEVAAHVSSYFNALGTEILKSSGMTVSPQAKAAPGAPRTTDWDTWLPNQAVN